MADDLRLECLRLAVETGGPGAPYGTVIDAASRYWQFVTKSRGPHAIGDSECSPDIRHRSAKSTRGRP